MSSSLPDGSGDNERPEQPSLKLIRSRVLIVDAEYLNEREIGPDTKFPVPLDEYFTKKLGAESADPDPPREFLAQDELTMVGQALIDKNDTFRHLRGWNVEFLWKRKGGQKGGMSTLGKCVPHKGLTAYHSGKEFTIWAAADNCFSFTWWQAEALLYHELLHIVENEDPEGKKTLGTQGHEWEGFFSEIVQYGNWRNSIRELEKAFQMKLFE